tara:strand:- start:1692 stop:3731 length:2040 start_codon:yes stop_codon:yes gene_type:complete
MYVGIDVGGTFTDIAINFGDGENVKFYKLPSSPKSPENAIVLGLSEIFKSYNILPEKIIRMSHGTTVGTNALIEKKSGKVAIVTTRGFRDLLELGRQTRPTVYDMHKDHPTPIVNRSLRFELNQRILADGKIKTKLKEEEIEKLGKRIKNLQIDCVVICFLHSYAFPNDEEKTAKILSTLLPKKVKIITSSSVYPEFREYERFSTAVLNGALITIISSYLDRLSSKVAEMGIISDVKICQSSGGLMSSAMAKKFPVRASLSGPAAGVQGAINRAVTAGFKNIITLDVGGTSADVALILNGKPMEVNERLLAGFPIRIPALDVNAVGAGGGSIAWVDKDGLLKVGPQSAGAEPGPACYDKGGKSATVTDANVYLGRLNNKALLEGRMLIKETLASKSIGEIAKQINLSKEETAIGIIKVACSTMVKAIRSISVERGYDPREFVLFVYGGAGALHAIEVAKELGIKQIVIPPSPGILCAEGAMNSFLTNEFVQTVFTKLDEEGISKIRALIEILKLKIENWFAEEEVQKKSQKENWFIGARYFGQNYELILPVNFKQNDKELITKLKSAFQKAHESNYGFASDKEPIQVVNILVKGIGKLDRPNLPLEKTGTKSKPEDYRKTFFEKDKSLKTPVYKRNQLVRGQTINGPAIIEQMDSTAVIFPKDIGKIDNWGNLIISIEG